MEDESIHIVMEYAEKGDLYKVRNYQYKLFLLVIAISME